MRLYAFNISGAVRAEIFAECFAEAFHIADILKHCGDMRSSDASVLSFDNNLLNTDFYAHFGEFADHAFGPFRAQVTTVVEILFQLGMLIIEKITKDMNIIALVGRAHFYTRNKLYAFL